MGLCFRCEYRAAFLEGGRRPRHECGVPECDKHICYMYEPVKPVQMEKFDKDDPRPEHGGYFGCRMQYTGIPEVELKIKETKSKSVAYWVPKEEDSE